MSRESLAQSFTHHLEIRLAGLVEDLESTGFDAVLVDSGRQRFFFRDDQSPAFRTNAHFLHFCPFAGPNNLLLLTRDETPVLFALLAEDFWYEPPSLGDPFWAGGFRIVRSSSRREQAGALLAELENRRTASISEKPHLAEMFDLTHNPAPLLARMDWRRAVKTPYEIQCISEANEVAARGHRMAESAFRDGGSEAAIHRAFMAGVGGVEAELPYPTIVALDEKGAILHYEGKRPDHAPGRSLLIDAGTETRGYASDITRTCAGEGASDDFRALIAAMDRAQLDLVAESRAGRPWAEVHLAAHHALASVLREQQILRVSPEEAVESGLSRAFFPHGIGHFLGLQVHDVGGHLRDPDGRVVPPPKSDPALRTTRVLEPGTVVTIEPGIYFIESLLAPWREGENASAVNWEAVDALAPFGGVRIEDDVVVTGDGPRNLTREYLD